MALLPNVVNKPAAKKALEGNTNDYHESFREKESAVIVLAIWPVRSVRYLGKYSLFLLEMSAFWNGEYWYQV